MAPTVYTLDPDYDTVIILTNPCTNFAPWDPYADDPESVETESCGEAASDVEANSSDSENESPVDVAVQESDVEDSGEMCESTGDATGAAEDVNVSSHSRGPPTITEKDVAKPII
jgi:hypothetical protein